jgi:adenine-specific DNA methylase
MKARADYTKKLVEEDSEEEEGDDLKVIDEDNSAEDVEQPAVKSKSRSKGKQKAADPEDAAPIARRRKRPAVDVFTGGRKPHFCVRRCSNNTSSTQETSSPQIRLVLVEVLRQHHRFLKPLQTETKRRNGKSLARRTQRRVRDGMMIVASTVTYIQDSLLQD